MAEVSVTPADLKARYPEFNLVPDLYMDAVLQEAALDVGDDWIASARVPAILALAAHRMTLDGEPARSISGGAAADSGGVVKRIKVGDVETEFAVSESTGAALGPYSAYGGSSYGQTFLRLLRRSFPPVLIV